MKERPTGQFAFKSVNNNFSRASLSESCRFLKPISLSSHQLSWRMMMIFRSERMWPIYLRDLLKGLRRFTITQLPSVKSSDSECSRTAGKWSWMAKPGFNVKDFLPAFYIWSLADKSFGFGLFFNGISNFVGYVMQKLFM